MIWSTLQLASKQCFSTQHITARADLFLNYVYLSVILYIWFRGYKPFFMLMFSLLINMKMSKTVGIFIFISNFNAQLCLARKNQQSFVHVIWDLLTSQISFSIGWAWKTTVLRMKRLVQTESPIFVILCVLCFQMQSFFTFILPYCSWCCAVWRP